MARIGARDPNRIRRVKFVVDMNLSPDWVAELAVHGHAAVHWQELGPGDAPDGAIIERAARMASAILTADLDFGEVVTLLGLSGPSIVQLRTDSTNPARIGHLVAEAIAQA